MSSGEGAPLPELRIEEQILYRFGYEGVIDQTFTLGDGRPFRAGSFLDVYRDGEHRADTADKLQGFMGMNDTDEGYDVMQAYIANFLRAQFGPR